LKSASRADGVRLVVALTAAVLLAAIATGSAQSKPAAPAAPAAWLACAGGASWSQFVLPVRRLTALNDKAQVEADVAKVFAQREKEQRVSTANLAKARLSIDFLYVAGEGTRRQYYFEASKTLPHGDPMDARRCEQHRASELAIDADAERGRPSNIALQRLTEAWVVRHVGPKEGRRPPQQGRAKTGCLHRSQFPRGSS